MSYASPLGTRGSILSWEDMSRSFGANVDELGTFLTDVSAPFTPRDRTVSVFSDASMTGMSDAWGSPRTSGIGLTPSLSISQVMFPSPPTDAAADASFGDITATSPIRPDDVSTQGEELDEEADAQQLFGPADPDERQAAVMLLQMQLAALEGVREERDALRAEREELLAARQRAEDEERARMMQEEVAQEERVARVAAEERASEEAQRVSEAQSAIREMQGRLRAEAARGAAAEWRAAVDMLRAELERVKAEREVLDVVRDCAAIAAAASA
ncbi:hypothetical protein AURDEDRAFT_114830 [Auricularia subglabra TFB-10046 SS5]|nr:hypothetical protein AURDEDRAFT_114830 [Auricularia subglabra TFB-10046 SS5]